MKTLGRNNKRISDFTFIQHIERGVNHRRFNKFAITAADFFCKPDRIVFPAKIRFFGIAFSVSSLQINSPGSAEWILRMRVPQYCSAVCKAILK